ncbi:unnamed protein product [Darwinula stevensoni]|uniref:furin n=1 Tax=Darwinula stevensoni TaxID=69355 RepID=A0A7R8XFX1_9CRUS|nr:unnamed protein product [Darwinula stevensoni]CAG0895477.1 unnamed protein product [Darwinula stevensoni]
MDAFVRWERPEDVTRMREWVTRSRKGACVDGGKGLLEKTAEKCAYEGESARTGMAAHSRVHPLSCKPTLAWNEIRRTQKVFKIPVKNPSTPAKEGKVRFVCMSDTHNRTKNLPFVVPKGDVLIHAGDFTYIGETEEITAFNEWLGELPHKFKVVIAGNHELSFDPLYEGKLPEVLRATHIGHGVLSPIPRRGQAGDHLASDVNRKAAEQAKKLLTNAIYLEDSSTMLYGIKIYGTPWQPEFGQGAFNLPRGEECLAKWDLIPDDTDILVKWLDQQRERHRVKRSSIGGRRMESADLASFFHSLREFHEDSQRSSLSQGSFPFPDPLYGEQWYLHGGADGGWDMNVAPVWKKGYTGKGVVISILDDGIQHDHPDIHLNYDPLASYDINDKDPDPMPRNNGDNKHGTRCAGEVSATAFNHYCGVGVAYNSSIGGVRMLDGPVNDAVEAHALSLNPDHIDIYSASWGPEDDGKTVDGPGPLARRAFINGIMKGRSGKGSIFVWASGNGGRHVDNCNCDGYTNSIFTLSISSATQRGLKPWYLEECASTLATTYSSGTPSQDKGVATCDQDAELRHDRICTVEHTGTSASAPIAGAICALALEANHELTWRDMQYLVVMTSRPEPLQREGGWVTNGVNRQVSHMFGYGLMDAEALVNLAERWTTVPPQHICQTRTDTTQRTIPSEPGGTLEATMSTDGCAGTLNEVRFLEHVQCKITLRFLPRGNLRIMLTSPMGTPTTLLFERPRDVLNSNFDEWPFLSVHFWGEAAPGVWKLTIANAGKRRVSQPGLLRSWQMIFYGTDINPVRLKDGGSTVSQVGQRHPMSFFPPSSSSTPFVRPRPHPLHRPTPQPFFHSFPNIFSLAGSSKVETWVDVNGTTVNPRTSLSNATCHKECSDSGCFGPGPHQCHQCLHFQHNTSCVKACPEGTYSDAYRKCGACHESCASCTGPNLNQCLACTQNLFYILDLSLCVSMCPEGYLQEEATKHCITCEPHCASCAGSPNHCIHCDHHLFLLNHTCVPTCPLGYFETSYHSCEACDESCETCVGSESNSCATCYPGMYHMNGTCMKSCPLGFYGHDHNRECYQCPPGDHPIPDSNEVQFKLCQYFDGERCRPCHETCDLCRGGEAGDCVSCVENLFFFRGHCYDTCPEGYYESPDGTTCLQCAHGCLACSLLDQCRQCDSGLFLKGGRCMVSCEMGYYSDLGTCRACDPSCASCSGPENNQCLECPEGRHLAGGQCPKLCPNGYFPKSPDTCLPCHQSCRTCTGSSITECVTCLPNGTLRDGLCVPCLASQYYSAEDGNCHECHPTCGTCSGPDERSCNSCIPTLKFDHVQGLCLPCCQEVHLGTPCCHCDPHTGKCVGIGHETRFAHLDSAESEGEEDGKGNGLFGGGVGGVSATGLIVVGLLVLLITTLVLTLVLRGRRQVQYDRLPQDLQPLHLAGLDCDDDEEEDNTGEGDKSTDERSKFIQT